MRRRRPGRTSGRHRSAPAALAAERLVPDLTAAASVGNFVLLFVLPPDWMCLRPNRAFPLRIKVSEKSPEPVPGRNCSRTTARVPGALVIEVARRPRHRPGPSRNGSPGTVPPSALHTPATRQRPQRPSSTSRRTEEWPSRCAPSRDGTATRRPSGPPSTPRATPTPPTASSASSSVMPAPDAIRPAARRMRRPGESHRAFRAVRGTGQTTWKPRQPGNFGGVRPAHQRTRTSTALHGATLEVRRDHHDRDEFAGGGAAEPYRPSPVASRAERHQVASGRLIDGTYVAVADGLA